MSVACVLAESRRWTREPSELTYLLPDSISRCSLLREGGRRRRRSESNDVTDVKEEAKFSHPSEDDMVSGIRTDISRKREEEQELDSRVNVRRSPLLS